MTRAEIALLLGLAAARDYRKIGETDVLAWHQDLEDLDFEDAKIAVSLHYRESTDRIMPGHVRKLVKQIRDERRREAGKHEARALPSRFEPDVTRNLRIERGLAGVAPVLEQIRQRMEQRKAATDGELSESDRLRQRALDRSHGRIRDEHEGAA